MAAVMLGEGEAMFQGEVMPGGAAVAEDRYMASDLQIAAFMIADGSLVQGLNMPAYVLGRLTA